MCDCDDCLHSDNPCGNDCDSDADECCQGCQEAREGQEEQEFEFNCSIGKI